MLWHLATSLLLPSRALPACPFLKLLSFFFHPVHYIFFSFFFFFLYFLFHRLLFSHNVSEKCRLLGKCSVDALSSASTLVLMRQEHTPRIRSGSPSGDVLTDAGYKLCSLQVPVILHWSLFISTGIRVDSVSDEGAHFWWFESAVKYLCLSKRTWMSWFIAHSRKKLSLLWRKKKLIHRVMCNDQSWAS